MLIQLIFVGKTKPKAAAAAVSEYTSRLERLTRIGTQQIRDEKIGQDADAARAREGARVLAALRPADWVVLCDERGNEVTTPMLKDVLERARSGQSRYSGRQRLGFVVGGALGVAAAVSKRADSTIRLSGLVMAGGVARVVLVEAIYRALTLVHGHPYHNE